MSEAAERIKQQLAGLSLADQFAIAEYLWEVVESPEWDRTWAAESQRRWDSGERGESAYMLREESMRQANEKLERLP